MANLIAAANAALTGGSTWALTETGTGAEQLTSSNTTNSTTSYVYCPTFTGTNTNVVDGVMIKVTRSLSTGTFSVALSDDNGVTATREVTVNVSDLPLSQATYVFFKFGSTLTLDGGTDYRVGVKSSTTNAVIVHRSSTTADWVHLLRRTTLATAGAGDNFYILGEWTAAGTVTTRTVTMDSTSATDYGLMYIGDHGTLTYGTTAATSYVLRLSGDLQVWPAGTLNIGTTGTPIPRDSTAVLEFDCTTDGEFGLSIFQLTTVFMQGLSRTSGKNVIACKLNTDEAVNSTALGVDTDTGWLDNDEIVVTTTTQTASQCEAGALNGNAGASSLTVDGFAGVSGGLAFAHSGTSPTQAEVVLLTRNVKVRSVSSTAMAYVFASGSAAVDIDWVEFRYLGENIANKRGIELSATTNFDIQFSCIRDCEDNGFYILGSTTDNLSFQNNVMWNCANVAGPAFNFSAATAGSATISGNYIIRTLSNNCMTLGDVGGTITNNVCVGATASGFSLTESGGVIGTFSGNVAHGCTADGLNFAGSSGIFGNISNCTFWRNADDGISITNGFAVVELSSITCFGNTGEGIEISTLGSYLHLKNCVFASDTTFNQDTGIEFASVGLNIVIADNCTFGVASGILTGLSDSDIELTINAVVQMLLRDCTLASASEFGPADHLLLDSSYGWVSAQRLDGTNGNHKTWLAGGILTPDSTIYNTQSPSLRIAPASSVVKTPSAPIWQGAKAPVRSGEVVDVSVWTRKSASGDGAQYNGNQPRLIVRANPAIGIAADTVLDTHSVTFGTWEQLSGTTAAVTADGVLEFIVDCDGTAGWVNVDDWEMA